MEATSVDSTQITSNCEHVKGLCNETFKIPVAPKQRLYHLTECNVGIRLTNKNNSEIKCLFVKKIGTLPLYLMYENGKYLTKNLFYFLPFI